MTEFEKAVFTEALKVYGKQAQIAMVFEEMSELQKELCKNLRGKKNLSAIEEELADVEIMLDQMKILFDCEAYCVEERNRKVARLLERIRKNLDVFCCKTTTSSDMLEGQSIF